MSDVAKAVVGLFVGGRSSRMGGEPKGLLPAPDTGEPLVVRLARLCEVALGASRIVLVGDATAYRDLGLTAIADLPTGVGPMGGLSALLDDAERMNASAIALACDLPRVTDTLIAHLAAHAPMAAAVAAHADGLYNPFFARYSTARCRPVVDQLLSAERHSLQGVFDALAHDAVALPLLEEELRLLSDWDRPEDVQS